MVPAHQFSLHQLFSDGLVVNERLPAGGRGSRLLNPHMLLAPNCLQLCHLGCNPSPTLVATHCRTQCRGGSYHIDAAQLDGHQSACNTSRYLGGTTVTVPRRQERKK
jgi:hypothetical protein